MAHRIEVPTTYPNYIDEASHGAKKPILRAHEWSDEFRVSTTFTKGYTHEKEIAMTGVRTWSAGNSLTAQHKLSNRLSKITPSLFRLRPPRCTALERSIPI